MHDADLLIVGQGLAGTFAALEGLRRGLSVRVVDAGPADCASRVGAGLYTPVTGKRFALTWRAAELLPFARRRYAELEAETGARFHRALPTLRLLDGPDEVAGWQRRGQRPEVAAFTREPHAGELDPFPVAPPAAAAVVDGSGWVDLRAFLDLFRRRFASIGILTADRFRWEEAHETAAGVVWRRARFGHVVLCEGFRGAENPLLARLPFRNARGDVLEVEIPGFPETHVVNRGIFILPIGHGRFRVGATFDWARLEPRGFDDGRAELETRLRSFLRAPFTVVEHLGGVRPVCVRTRPVLGLLPGHPRVGVINGFGAKGVLYAPFFAFHFFQTILANHALDFEIDVRSRLL